MLFAVAYYSSHPMWHTHNMCLFDAWVNKNYHINASNYHLGQLPQWTTTNNVTLSNDVLTKVQVFFW